MLFEIRLCHIRPTKRPDVNVSFCQFLIMWNMRNIKNSRVIRLLSIYIYHKKHFLFERTHWKKQIRDKISPNSVCCHDIHTLDRVFYRDGFPRKRISIKDARFADLLCENCSQRRISPIPPFRNTCTLAITYRFTYLPSNGMLFNSLNFRQMSLQTLHDVGSLIAASRILFFALKRIVRRMCSQKCTCENWKERDRTKSRRKVQGSVRLNFKQSVSWHLRLG